MATQDAVGPGDAAVVLHRPAELRQEHLVIAALREGHAEALAEEGEALCGEREQLLRVALERGGQGLAGVEPEVVTTGFAAHLGERAGHHDRVVRGQRRGGLEGPPLPVLDVLDHRIARVAHHRPCGRRGDGERMRRLEVRLVEAGPRVARLVGLERGPQVDVVVAGVDRAVHTPPVGGVALDRGDHELVVLGEGRQRDPPLPGSRQRLAVERGRLHLRAAVDEGRRARRGGEAHRADRSEGGTVDQAGEVDGDVVGGD